jgi:hypothetical protein
MILQQILAGVIVLGAVGYLGRLVYRSFRSEKACGGACKCEPAKKVGSISIR